MPQPSVGLHINRNSMLTNTTFFVPILLLLLLLYDSHISTLDRIMLLNSLADFYKFRLDEKTNKITFWCFKISKVPKGIIGK